MSRSTEHLAAQLDALSRSYRESLPTRLGGLEEAWSQVTQGASDVEAWKVMHRGAHSLAGSAASFGLAAVSQQARRLEELVEAAMSTRSLRGADRTDIDAAFQALRAVCKSVPPTPERAALALEATPPTVAASEDAKLVCVVEGDGVVAAEIATQLQHFGYRIQTFSRLTEFRESLPAIQPAAVVMDTELADASGVCAAAELLRGQATTIPTVFVSASGDLESRLDAVRAGGDGYFVKPVDGGELLDLIDALTRSERQGRARVLIVEDTTELAEYYALTLKRAGMDAVSVHEPMQLLEVLDSYHPDLILMDIYLPGCTGFELASVIRQQQAYVSVPIVYLSTETDLAKQMQGMQIGGDDFLTKPISPERLVGAVRSRVQRHRVLRNLMIRDSLTGLMNHTTVKERLETEVARARRNQSALAFAMIDIDEFKSINDTYGHPLGDRVIQSLARFLKQRLRKPDAVGRYGGEEFAVVLPDTSVTNALTVFNELRVGFAAIRHHGDGKEFGVTFSCGVAGFSGDGDASRLCDAADAALYEAKRAGRNRCVAAAQSR